MRSLLACSVFVFVLGWITGCSSTATHDLTLISPVSEPCNKMKDPNCMPVYASCDDLVLKDIRLAVGVFDREVTIATCPPDLDKTGRFVVPVSYTPGGNFYMIEASFPRDEMTLYIAAGPFPENAPDLPWQVLLR